MSSNASPIPQNQQGHNLQSTFLCSQIPSTVLISNNSQPSVQYSSPSAGIFPNAGPSLNVMHALPGASAIGVCSNGNFLPTELRAQGFCVEQSQIFIGSPPGPSTPPSPFYQNLLSIPRDGRTTHEPISRVNQDQLTVENHPGFVAGLQQRAQGAPSINKTQIMYHSHPNCMATGVNSRYQTITFQTEHSFNTPVHGSRELDLKPEYPISFDPKFPPRNVNGSLSTSFQQQPLDFGVHRWSQEEKHGQAEKDQDPVLLIRSSKEKKAAFEKFEKIRKQKFWSKLYGFHSPLHYAIQMNDTNKVRQLLKTSNPNSYHKETGETPMHLACRLGRLTIVKLLRRHPWINMELKTISCANTLPHPGKNAMQIARTCGDMEVVHFLDHFQSKDHQKNAEQLPLEYKLKINHGLFKQQLRKLKASIVTLTKENEKLKKKLKDLELEDANVMGIKLPRKKPKDTKKLAEVLKIVRELLQDLTARQQRMWTEKEDEKLCNICTERHKDIVLVPCGHVFCSVCSWAVQSCPNCRKRIKDRIKTYK